MKKIFLPLLAAVGIALGFTLTSCGGGGGSEKGNEPARALVGITMQETTLWPGFILEFREGAIGWVVPAVFYPGDGSDHGCFFNLDEKEPPELENGVWKFKGKLGGVEGIRILKDNNFLALIGVNQSASSCVVDSFKLLFYIPSGATGRYSASGQIWVKGRYFMTGQEAEGTLIRADDKDVSFMVDGKLNEKWLSDSTEEEEEDKPFDY